MLRICLLLVLLAGSAPAWALESAPVRSSRLTATLITDTDAAEAGRPFRVALRLRMAPGWHTYWQNPGDAGAPAEIKLTVPPGASAGEVAWPTPKRLPEGPVMTYAYEGEVVLPISVTPGAGAVAIQAAATWLVCEKICVPEEGTFSLALPAGRAAPAAEAALFAATETRLPRPSPFEARIAADGTLSLEGAGLSPATVRDAWFFPAAWGPIEQGAAQPVTIRDGMVAIGLKPGSGFAPGATLAGTVVLRDPGGQESYLAIAAAPGPAGATVPVAQTLLLALLGGLILNLMPCVFPVLAMKTMAVARMSGAARGTVRAHAVFYTAGVLAAFLALGAMLLAARAAGGLAGWGFQFQSPVFVAGMAWVLFGVGLNLSGVFRIGGGLAGAGQGLAGRGGHAGSFFTGLLAVLVATPCTAPFMGAAIAAGLAAPMPVTLLVFLAMGVGMAAPYAALAVFPRAAGVLPRPGPWMDVLRGALAFPMYGAAAWLVWVVSLQAGPAGVLATISGLVLLGFAAWALGLAQEAGQRGRQIGRAAAAVSVLAAAAVLSGIAATAPAAAPSQAEAGAEPFTPARLAALRAEGRPVFVNMTAAWCVTCLVNERVALSPEPVRQALAARGVAYLKGDWTRGDPDITAFLRGHARDGVPLYVLYPPSPAPPTVLPQILTAAEMLSQLSKLGG